MGVSIAAENENEDLVVLESAFQMPEIEREPDVLLPIAGRTYRIHDPKLIAWRPLLIAEQHQSEHSAAIARDEFLQLCMDPDDWDDLLRTVRESSDPQLDWPVILEAGGRAIAHYGPTLKNKASALGAALSSEDSVLGDNGDGGGSQTAAASG